MCRLHLACGVLCVRARAFLRVFEHEPREEVLGGRWGVSDRGVQLLTQLRYPRRGSTQRAQEDLLVPAQTPRVHAAAAALSTTTRSLGRSRTCA